MNIQDWYPLRLTGLISLQNIEVEEQSWMTEHIQLQDLL